MGTALPPYLMPGFVAVVLYLSRGTGERTKKARIVSSEEL